MSLRRNDKFLLTQCIFPSLIIIFKVYNQSFCCLQCARQDEGSTLYVDAQVSPEITFGADQFYELTSDFEAVIHQRFLLSVYTFHFVWSVQKLPWLWPWPYSYAKLVWIHVDPLSMCSVFWQEGVFFCLFFTFLLDRRPIMALKFKDELSQAISELIILPS